MIKGNVMIFQLNLVILNFKISLRRNTVTESYKAFLKKKEWVRIL